MKAFYAITPAGRWKLIALLSGILVILVLTGLIADYKLSRIHHSFSSIYTDRLIPATEIYFISDHLYEKRLLLDEQISADGLQTQEFLASMQRRDDLIDSILVEYEKTYFVNEESRCVKDLKQNLSAYKTSEKEIILLLRDRSYTKARELFDTQSRQEFHQVVERLHYLTRIQSSVGKELMAGSNADFASTSILSYLRAGLSIAIGLIIFFFARASSVTSKVNQKFHLN